MKLFILGLVFLTVGALARENYRWLTWVCVGGLGVIVMTEYSWTGWERRMRERKRKSR